MARKFIVEKENIKKIENGNYIIYGSEINHIKAMRYEVSDNININNKEYSITKIEKEHIEIEYIKDAIITGVPQICVTLFQALVKNDKMEYIIQKAVELGISKIVPIASKNVVVKLDEKEKNKKVERWNKISIEATKQCGRGDIVEVESVINLKDIVNMKDFDYILFAYEENNNSLKEVISEIKKRNITELNFAIIIGAEGGFAKEEVQYLLKKCDNLKVVSLGSRILRAETASLNLLSILMYEFDNK